MNGDIDAYRDPMDMLREATQYLRRVRQILIEADRFEDILQIWPEREAMQRLRPDEFNLSKLLAGPRKVQYESSLALP